MENEKNNAGDGYTDEELRHRFRAVLDRHGHSFQYAVIKRITELYRTHRVWDFECSEFPVNSWVRDTRIDFLLHAYGFRFYLVCECKRANPALGDWCFVKSPFVRRSRNVEQIFIEHVVSSYADDQPHPTKLLAHGATVGYVQNAYHIGLER